VPGETPTVDPFDLPGDEEDTTPEAEGQSGPLDELAPLGERLAALQPPADADADLGPEPVADAVVAALLEGDAHENVNTLGQYKGPAPAPSTKRTETPENEASVLPIEAYANIPSETGENPEGDVVVDNKEEESEAERAQAKDRKLQVETLRKMNDPDYAVIRRAGHAPEFVFVGEAEDSGSQEDEDEARREVEVTS